MDMLPLEMTVMIDHFFYQDEGGIVTPAAPLRQLSNISQASTVCLTNNKQVFTDN